MPSKLRGLDPVVRERAEVALAWADHFRIPVAITSGFRSWQQQRKLRANFDRCVAQGRFPSPPDCRFPANQPGDSAHNFGLAFDSVTSSGDQEDWNIIREWVGFRVPGNDLIHAEVPGWRQFVPRRR